MGGGYRRIFADRVGLAPIGSVCVCGQHLAKGGGGGYREVCTDHKVLFWVSVSVCELLWPYGNVRGW